MVLSIPRYPEFSDLIHWADQEAFYVPELEMCFGEICSAMKKSWYAYKLARKQGDTELQEEYADTINGIIDGLGYKPMKFRIAEYYDEHPDTEEFEPTESDEVEEIDEQVKRQRKMAVSYGKTFKRYDWHAITQQYVRYIEPDDVDDGYIMEAEGEDLD